MDNKDDNISPWDHLRAMGVTRTQILLIAVLVFINFCVAVAAIQDLV